MIPYRAEIYTTNTEFWVSKLDNGIFDASPALLNLQKTRSYSYDVKKISWRQIKTGKNSFKFKESSSDAQFDERTQRERTCFLSKTCSYEFFAERTILQEIFRVGYANWTLVNASLENSWSLWAFFVERETVQLKWSSRKLFNAVANLLYFSFRKENVGKLRTTLT